jgi:acyl-CoA reductase-like NAD-dependent aldehyde dehydrogenase
MARAWKCRSQQRPDLQQMRAAPAGAIPVGTLSAYDRAVTHTTTTVNPATEETLEHFEHDTPQRVEAALQAAREAFSTWRTAPIERRAELLRGVAARLRDEEATHARHILLEMGKPIQQARAEVAKCARACDYFAEQAPRLLADEAVPSDASESYASFEPLGPVLAVMPWNFPYWQVFRAAAPALMAGNVMLLKHALSVSRCALEIARVFERAGAPRGLFQTLLVDHQSVQTMLGDPRVVAATLTGSERAGVSLARDAGAQIKKTVLELGGSDAFIVLADADVEQARFQNAGQSCIAAKRFFVENAVASEFTERFIEGVRALRTGDPTNDATSVGPLARADLRDELERQVRSSLDAGARVLIGGKRPAGKGYFYEPTLLADVPPEAPVLTEEVFGPAAPIVIVRDADEAIAKANASRFGLSNNLWTRDLDKARRLARELESGGVFINGMTASDPRLPFGGIKKSGYGRELSVFGLREFVNVKTVWIGPGKESAQKGSVE